MSRCCYGVGLLAPASLPCCPYDDPAQMVGSGCRFFGRWVWRFAGRCFDPGAVAASFGLESFAMTMEIKNGRDLLQRRPRVIGVMGLDGCLRSGEDLRIMALGPGPIVASEDWVVIIDESADIPSEVWKRAGEIKNG